MPNISDNRYFLLTLTIHRCIYIYYFCNVCANTIKVLIFFNITSIIHQNLTYKGF